ncbi:hypothetical protein [Amycolatopsis sp. MtRt-6]|uniref:hypothetical protein n=1 Tax=Amycolatopsis sp. MtRt-6 TaxID=2792782 RepID=UPI001A8C6002|nr:hypothetical protein [Amycolatopsis sp. MtRt-6]
MSDRALRAWLAAVALLGAVAHAGAVPADPGLAVVFAVMAVACVPCAVRVWRHDSTRALVMLGATAAAMVLVHLALMARAHGGHGSLAVLTVVEILVVAGVWYALRHRAPEQEQS